MEIKVTMNSKRLKVERKGRNKGKMEKIIEERSIG